MFDSYHLEYPVLEIYSVLKNKVDEFQLWPQDRSILSLFIFKFNVDYQLRFSFTDTKLFQDCFLKRPFFNGIALTFVENQLTTYKWFHFLSLFYFLNRVSELLPI